MAAIMSRIRLFRTQRGMTQEALAEKVGVSRQAVAKWEKGDTTPDIDSCIRLADAFGVPLEVLARGLTPREEAAEGRQMYGCVRMNDKGQITLPVQVREAFGLKPGCLVLVLADTEKGIALMNIGSMPEGAVVVPPETPGKRDANERH